MPARTFVMVVGAAILGARQSRDRQKRYSERSRELLVGGPCDESICVNLRYLRFLRYGAMASESICVIRGLQSPRPSWSSALQRVAGGIRENPYSSVSLNSGGWGHPHALTPSRPHAIKTSSPHSPNRAMSAA